MKDILIKSLGIENFSEEDQNKLIESLGAVVYQAVITRAMEEMNDDQIEEFENLTNQNPTPEILLKYFIDKIPNFEKMMQEEAKRMLEDNTNIINTIKGN